MIHLCPPGAAGTAPPVIDTAAVQAAVWVDLDCPTAEERQLVNDSLGITLPTTADLNEIEASSRVYRDNGASYMTALVATGIDNGQPESAPVGFVLTPAGALVTIRFTTPRAFRMALQQVARAAPPAGGRAMLLRLFDLIVDRAADVLELLASRIDGTSGIIFGRTDPSEQRLSPRALEELLREIGTSQFALNKVHESLQTLSRVVSFLTLATEDARPARPERDLLKSLVRDIQSLTENSTFLMQNVFFLLDAAVGRISIEQNAIIKILSFASIVLMPPTLIAGIYGMNFHIMPELDWHYGYPAVLVVMLLSAVLPLWYCRRKGWF